MKWKTRHVLILIFLLGLFLRTVHLASHPVSLSWDEVAIGYNAFTIAQKGVDEYGTPFPLLFRSFDDFKLPGYIYTDAFFIKLFGFSDFMVRFPSALFGSFFIFVIYFLFKKLFTERVGLIGAFLTAISPWALQFSRAAFEANVGLFFTTLGITLLLYGIKNKLLALLSIPILFSSLYFYYSQRLVVPVIFITFLFLFWKKIQQNKKEYLVGFIVALILITPIALQIVGPHGLKRMAEVSIIQDNVVSLDYILAREKHSDSFYSYFINRRIPVVFESLHHYFQHFSLGFLFFGEDPNARHRAYVHGLLYLVEIPLLIIGGFIFWKLRKREEKYFILAWLLIAPIPAALAKETPHGLRALLLLPPLLVLVSLAIEKIIISNKKLFFVLVGGYILFFVNYLLAYYFVYPIISSKWGYGYKQVYEKVFSIEKQYKQILITGDYWKPRIYYQYYKKSPDEKVKENNGMEKIGKYLFAPTYWDSNTSWDIHQVKVSAKNPLLLVLSDKEYEQFKSIWRLKKIEEIRDYSGRKLVFVIVEFTGERLKTAQK